jgi:hypothetical protein
MSKQADNKDAAVTGFLVSAGCALVALFILMMVIVGTATTKTTHGETCVTIASKIPVAGRCQ